MTFVEEKIREKIKKLYAENAKIHISITQTRPKLVLKSAEATIIGVYLHIFCVEENSRGIVQRHSIRYADILSRRIKVEELDE